jgi:hypothetical protein
MAKKKSTENILEEISDSLLLQEKMPQADEVGLEPDNIEVFDLNYPPRVKNLGVWTIKSEVSGKVPFEITYLTSGINWRAFYMGTLSADEQTMYLQGYVRVANGSGEDYEDAQTRLYNETGTQLYVLYLPTLDGENMDTFGEKTWLTVPLVYDRALLGVMILIETEREREFTPEEVHLAGAIGEQAAVALNNALSHHREEERNRWLRSLVAAGRAVAEAPDPDTALSEVARLAAEAVQSPAAFIYQYARERDEFVMRAGFATPTTGRAFWMIAALRCIPAIPQRPG